MLWCKEVPQHKNLKTPRYILLTLFNRDSDLEIHTFSDDAAKTYGADLYVKFKVSLKLSLKKLFKETLVAVSWTNGALLAARLANELKLASDKNGISKSFFRTNFEITLH